MVRDLADRQPSVRVSCTASATACWEMQRSVLGQQNLGSVRQHPGLRLYKGLFSFYSGSQIAKLCLSILSLWIQSNSVLFAKFLEDHHGGAGMRTDPVPRQDSQLYHAATGA